MSIVVLFDFDNTIGYFTQYRELLHKINEIHHLNPPTKYNNNKTILRKLIKLNVLLRPNIINVLKYLTNNKNKLNILEINIFTKNTSQTIFNCLLDILYQDYGILFTKIFQKNDEYKLYLIDNNARSQEYIPFETIKDHELNYIVTPANVSSEVNSEVNNQDNEDDNKTVKNIESLFHLYNPETQYIIFDDKITQYDTFVDKVKNNVTFVNVIPYFGLNSQSKENITNIFVEYSKNLSIKKSDKINDKINYAFKYFETIYRKIMPNFGNIHDFEKQEFFILPITIANLSILQNKLSILENKLSILENNNTKLIQNVDAANDNPNTVFKIQNDYDTNDIQNGFIIGGYTKKNNFKYNRIKTRKIKPKTKK
jgi:hypothetical protein